LEEGGEWRGFELHGKVGRGCAIASDVVGVPLDIVCLPVTFPVGLIFAERPSCCWNFCWIAEPESACYIPVVPSLALERAFYCAGSALTYPLYLGTVALPRAIRQGTMTPEHLVAYMLDRMPYLSDAEYGKLVQASRRRWPPYYYGDVPGPDIWESWTDVPAFGHKTEMDLNVAEEWKAWDSAGRPAAGPEEATFVVDYLIFKHHYLLCGNERLKDIVGASYDELWEYGHGKPASEHPHFHRALMIEDKDWQRWIEGHGGIEKIVQERFGTPQQGAAPKPPTNSQ
jgi:hypothetical protein